MKKKVALYQDIFVSFIKIGGFTLGGGYAMIPIIQHQVVDVKQWVSEEDMADFMTLGQACPGVIGINTATAVGYKIAGIGGSIAATLGMIMPSLIIIMLIAIFLDNVRQWEMVEKAFAGIRAAVIALMFHAVIRFSKTSIQRKLQWVIGILAVILVLLFHVSPQYIILGGILAGIFLYLLKKVRKTDGHID